MFWGLIMEPNKRYTQNVKKSFHISMAALDVTSSDGEPSQVLCGYQGKNFLVCTLHKSGLLQCPIDLHFEEGTTVSFCTNGNSNVHLTGYLTAQLDEYIEEEENDEEPAEFQVKPQKKRASADSSPQPSKKTRISALLEDEEDDSEDDSDVDLEKLMANEDGELSEEESGEEEEGGEEEEDSDEVEGEESDLEEEEESDDDDEIEEEEISNQVKALLNGVDKKGKKGKKEETPKKEKQQAKEKLPPPKNLTPGPKNKKQENGDAEDKKKKGKDAKKTKENQTPNVKRTLPGGVIVEDLREGQGEAAANGKFVHVYYEGRLKTNNKVFDQTSKGAGFGFRLGKSEVIKGWDLGVAGMKVGGKRRITCPPHLAYGAKGSPPVIPPNATLVFDVELKKVK